MPQKGQKGKLGTFTSLARTVLISNFSLASSTSSTSFFWYSMYNNLQKIKPTANSLEMSSARKAPVQSQACSAQQQSAHLKIALFQANNYTGTPNSSWHISTDFCWGPTTSFNQWWISNQYPSPNKCLAKPSASLIIAKLLALCLRFINLSFSFIKLFQVKWNKMVICMGYA